MFLLHLFAFIISGGQVPPPAHSRGGSTKEVWKFYCFCYILILTQVVSVTICVSLGKA